MTQRPKDNALYNKNKATIKIIQIYMFLNT